MKHKDQYLHGSRINAPRRYFMTLSHQENYRVLQSVTECFVSLCNELRFPDAVCTRYADYSLNVAVCAGDSLSIT